MCAQALLAIAAARPAPTSPPGDARSDGSPGQPAAWRDTGKLPASAADRPPGDEPGLVKVSVPEARRLARLASAPISHPRTRLRLVTMAAAPPGSRPLAPLPRPAQNSHTGHLLPRQKGGRNVTNRDCSTWLRNIPFKLDIVQAEEKDWVTANGDALLSQAIAACIHPGIGLASATKVLHLKRPYLVPILDRFVAEMMGVNLPDNPSVTQRVAIGQRLAAAIRREGRRNIQVLRSIREELAAEGIERTLIRIFDGILWYSHPAAGVPGGERTISVGIRA
jgi:Family of unknown function (DUF6308)